jgi:hypothetical protein
MTFKGWVVEANTFSEGNATAARHSARHMATQRFNKDDIMMAPIRFTLSRIIR